MTKLPLEIAFSSHRKSGARRFPYSSDRGASTVDVVLGVFAYRARRARIGHALACWAIGRPNLASAPHKIAQADHQID